MRQATTLKNNYEFRRVYHKGESGVSSLLVVYAKRNRAKRNRLGVTVSVKIGGAVVRNRARRRLRELFRLSQPKMKQGYDIVLVARSRTAAAPYRELEFSYRRACAKLGLWGDRP